MSAFYKYTKVSEEEMIALKSIYESVFGESVTNEQIMFRGLGDIEQQKREVAPDRPIRQMDEQEEDLSLDDEMVDAIETDIENQIDPKEDSNLEGETQSAILKPEEEKVNKDYDDGQSTAESVIKMTVQMAIFKGIRDVADEFSKSFDIDKFALLARFQKYLLNSENLENAASSVVQLIKSKKIEQRKEERQQLIQQARKKDD